MKATLSFPSHPIPSPPCEKIIHGRGKKGEVVGGVLQKAITHKKYVYFFLLEEDEGKKKSLEFLLEHILYFQVPSVDYEKSPC